MGDDEADFKHNRISVNSPIARGLIGKEQGDIVVIKTPGGEVEFEILKVEYIWFFLMLLRVCTIGNKFCKDKKKAAMRPFY